MIILVFSFETYFERSCGFVEWLAYFYLVFFELSCVMCMLENLEFGV
jgi:hypothetical protein